MTDNTLTDDFLKTQSVLYVEDDPDVRELLAQYLRRRVGSLLTAENGEAGLSAYRQHQPDIIITDILMPVMDGLKMAEEIRKLDSDIPIIVTTAFEQTRFLMRAIEIGIDKYVVKPVDADLLMTAIRKCAKRLMAGEKLRLSLKVFENCAEGILITDAKNIIRWVNPAFTLTTGYTPEEVIGRNPRLFSSGRQGAEFYSAMWNKLSTEGNWIGEIWNRRKNGEIYPEWLSVSVLLDAHGKVTHHVAIFSDISERKAAEEKIRHMAYHDPLTGLPNRILLCDRMTMALANAMRKREKLAVMLIDLDNFKNVNDLYGHLMGDKLLQEVSSRLTVLFRASDTISRLGGDEFVVILNEMEETTAAIAAAEKIIRAITPDLAVDGQAMGISPSIGIAIYPQDGLATDELIKKADVAMYHAKRTGGRGFSFFSDSD